MRWYKSPQSVLNKQKMINVGDKETLVDCLPPVNARSVQIESEENIWFLTLLPEGKRVIVFELFAQHHIKVAVS
ncbi:CLUMA_CG001294, isoform A [Clunio marinus]|uniref:CLUMA_CG001294, isoform A n=1 Tax=Clunio marinus TaxID=568069 RepID=A0A1J1HHL3_9DIPT|nr:CLUMA_CG001294, isoform A [Clunio marinus]